jgi:two-component system sensor histidine kinase QseC
MQPLATSRDVVLACRPAMAILVLVDAEAFERAIVALIDNALRFSRANVNVDVTADAENALVTVSDDGPGFSDAALRQATGRFWRDDPARSGSGTGLGLAIVRSIVERHGGTIVLRNGIAGAGAVVVLTLPTVRTRPV